MHRTRPQAETTRPAPRALLVAVHTPDRPADVQAASLAELSQLARTLGFDVVEVDTQQRAAPLPSTYLGSGKLDALAERITAAAWPGGPVDLVVVNDALTPRQHRAMALALGLEVLDRPGVILEIFERHARTREARLEVEIARLRYALPRRRDDRSKVGREGGGGRGARGDTNVALDKARIRDRIASLQEELARAVEATRIQRARRGAREVYQVALVGYTNAGKSSLMRALTRRDVLVQDQLFATLGTTVRQLASEAPPPVVLADTVGFIRDLPHELVASFRTTLGEARDADLLLLVADASDPAWRDQVAVVRRTLADAEVEPGRVRLVLSKADRLSDAARAALRDEVPEAAVVSARSPEDVAKLDARIREVMAMGLSEETLQLPHTAGAVVAEVHARAEVLEMRYGDEDVTLRVRALAEHLDRWRARVSTSPASPLETVDAIVAQAEAYGLAISQHDAAVDDSGLDSRVVHATDDDGVAWVLRAPRREDVRRTARVEHRALRLLTGRLPVAVPDWRLHGPRLVAYPRLAGEPAWSLGEAGVSWRFDPTDVPSAFTDSLARILAALQRVSRQDVVAADLPALSLSEIRDRRRARLHATVDALSPSPAQRDRWEAWLDAADGWPPEPALTHGDLHPGHLLLDDSHAVVGVLDWTEVHLGDPAIDLATCYGSFGRRWLDQALDRLSEHGGEVWPEMAAHVAACWSFAPVEAAWWALERGDEAVLAHARQMLTWPDPANG